MAQFISIKKYNILTLALVVVLSLFVVYYAVQASSTVGTNLSTTGTMAVTGVTTLSANLVGTGASFSTNFEAVGYASVGGAFTVAGNTTLTGTLGVTGVTTLSSRLSGTSASLSTNFEAVGYASISKVFATSNLVAGSATASSSTTYTAEFANTGTTSVLFGGSSSTLGTCLQLKNTIGNTVYARVVGTTWTVNTLKCHN